MLIYIDTYLCHLPVTYRPHTNEYPEPYESKAFVHAASGDYFYFQGHDIGTTGLSTLWRTRSNETSMAPVPFSGFDVSAPPEVKAYWLASLRF